ncbi:MAG TPA: DUF4344 domain-containing metallopeptidase [Kofleriaceae bacterium]|nr:DUF4344 domain-containing metallopeptidase [Kofleriaceae bacterium]
MMNTQPSPEREPKNRRQVASGHRARGARGALWLAVHMGALVVLVASCVPYQQGQYQQGQYQQDPYQQDPYQQGQYGNGQASGYGSPTNAVAGMSVVYQPPTKKPEHEAIRSFLQENKTVERYSKGLSHIFQFPQAVNVVWTECGVVNAAWDGQGNIVMCYEMVEFLRGLFIKRIKDPKQLAVAVVSSLMFVFLHEFGHGLISLYKLPAVGREEDAADQLAGLVLIATGDSGIEVAMRGAQFFRLLALSGAKTPFFDEHSLDAQRYYNLLCMVYGSNPDRLKSLVGNDKLPASRARRCPTEYSKIYSAWADLLNPHMQRNRYAGQRSGYGNDPAPTSRGSSGYSDDSDDSDDSGYSDDSGNSGNSGNSGWWMCTAEGSLGTANGNGPMDYRTQTAYGDGPTRDEAGNKALKDCGAMMGFYKNLAWTSGQRTEGGSCSIANCITQSR